MTLKIIIAWLIFDAIVYFVMWFDTAYYRHNFPLMCRKIFEAFTEEE